MEYSRRNSSRSAGGKLANSCLEAGAETDELGALGFGAARQGSDAGAPRSSRPRRQLAT